MSQYLTHNYIMLSKMRHHLTQAFGGDDYGITREEKAEGIRQITGKMNLIGPIIGYDPIEIEPEYQETE